MQPEAAAARASDSERLTDLLVQVVSSSRALIDADVGAFEPALMAWLGGFGAAVGATRCTFYDYVDFENTGPRTARMLAEWARDGVAGSPRVSFAEPVVIDPSGAGLLMQQLTSGRAVALHTDEIAEPMRRFLAGQGNATVVAVPLVMDGRPWGCLSFDHTQRRTPQPAELAVLQAAADTLVTILKRNDVSRRLLAEREARLAAERQRSAELARANDALRLSLAGLGEADGELGFLRQSLQQLQAQIGATDVYLFSCDTPGGLLRLAGRVTQGQFSLQPRADDPPKFSASFEMLPSLLAELTAHGRLLWRPVLPASGPIEQLRETAQWHQRMGHRANALHALMVGARQVGLVGMVFDTAVPPSAAQQDLAHTLCQPLTLALELARLSRLGRASAERAAVLAERERLAAEIHDSLAQSFTSIAMQSESLAGRLVAEPESVRVLRMIERTAREGLAEARTSVLMLLPPAAGTQPLHRALAELAARSSVGGGIQCSFVSRGEPVSLAGPAHEALLRIAQEATSNAMRHSGGTRIVLQLDSAPGSVLLQVDDDGAGPPPPEQQRTAGGYGMAGMGARAQAVGARLHVGVAALGGYSVRVALDVEPHAAEGRT